MKRLYFKYGVMGSSKSAQALMTAFNYTQKGYKVLLIKPSVDTREKSPVISSRIGLTAPCFTFDKSTNLIDFVLKTDPDTQVLIVDEAQFCTKEQIDELKELTKIKPPTDPVDPTPPNPTLPYEKSANAACTYLIPHSGLNDFEFPIVSDELSADSLKKAQNICIEELDNIPFLP